VWVRRRAWRARREGRVPHEGRRRRRSPGESARARLSAECARRQATEEKRANGAWVGHLGFGFFYIFLFAIFKNKCRIKKFQKLLPSFRATPRD
jgi:hypothetical protein